MKNIPDNIIKTSLRILERKNMKKKYEERI